jgi:peptidoglycan/xylan/chitin deacetylase (PgdA/CDA1 family)
MTQPNYWSIFEDGRLDNDERGTEPDRKVVESARAARWIYLGGGPGSTSVNDVAGPGGGAVLADTTDFLIGTQCCSVVSNGTTANPGGGWGFSEVGRPSPLPDMTGHDLILLLKMQGMANVADLKFYVGSGGFATGYSWNLNESGTEYPFLRDGDWRLVTLPAGSPTVEFGGAPTLSNLNSWQLRTYDNNAGPVGMKLNAWGYLKRQSAFANGVVSFRFDDLLGSVWSKAAPKLAQYGFAATGYAIAETLRNPAQFSTYMTLQQAHVLEDTLDWEIGSHSNLVATHNANVGGAKGFTALSESAQRTEMLTIRSYLRDQGFRGADHFAYPQGAFDATTLRVASEVFSSAQTLAHPSNETLPVADPMRLRCYAPPSSVTGAQLIAEVDKVEADKGWLNILIHGVADTPGPNDISTTAFNALVDYLGTTANMPAVRRVSEVLEVANS